MKDAIGAGGIFRKDLLVASLQSMWKIGQSMPIVAETEQTVRRSYERESFL